MIQTKNITFTYPKGETFQFPDLECKPQETILITGNSGKGKTTYLHLLAGILMPTSGEIIVENTNINVLSSKNLDNFRGKNIGLVLQQSHFIASFTILENLVLASWLVSKKKAFTKAEELLKLLDLELYKNKLPSQLSVGQQQRVSIARALINNPKVVLADEPTSSLDDQNALIVSDLLENLCIKYNAALIIVTHDSRLKEKFSNQIVLS